jgi:uncharacterized protein YndB with AHSA1/START domain
MSNESQEGRGPQDEAFGEVTDPGVFRIERLLPGPIERVWSYLTDSDKRRKWFGDGPMQLRMDGQVELRFRFSDLTSEQTPTNEQEACTVVGQITRCDPPHVLSFTWDAESDASEVTFELTSRRDMVLLVITHRRLRGHDTIVRVASGWHTHVGLLCDVFDNKPRRPFWSTKSSLENAYRSRFSG